jgi:pimeloyl-ACP methyl ester carboxylesterase
MDIRTVEIRIGTVRLEADLGLPQPTRGLVLFAHGSGSSRHSPRNRFVASELNRAGLGTLLVDLLTPQEERVDATSGELRFDISFLARRLLDVASWVAQQEIVEPRCGLALFGASTGAAAALVAAAELGLRVAAVVSRGGRPDLAGDALVAVTAPTLLIVGGRDVQVLQLNRQALERLESAKRLEIVPGATHLFPEAGALEQVATLARDWFVEHLTCAVVSLPGGEPAWPR